MNIFQAIHEYSKSLTPFGTNMQSQNEFHLQPNLLFARNLRWTMGVANPKPWKKEVGHRLDRDESTLQLR